MREESRSRSYEGTKLTIEAPRASMLEVSVVSASIAARAIEGEQRLQSVSGSIDAEAFASDLNVSSVSGAGHGPWPRQRRSDSRARDQRLGAPHRYRRPSRGPSRERVRRSGCESARPRDAELDLGARVAESCALGEQTARRSHDDERLAQHVVRGQGRRGVRPHDFQRRHRPLLRPAGLRAAQRTAAPTPVPRGRLGRTRARELDERLDHALPEMRTTPARI